jgi:origin recognition complex subunit 5
MIYQPSFPTPPSVVLHGLQATGKTAATQAVLQALKTPHAIIESRECITGRQLLERSFAASVEALSKQSDTEIDLSAYGRCENLSALQVHLERLLENQKKFTLVFDGIDQQREAPSTLIPALARFGETVRIVLIHPKCFTDFIHRYHALQSSLSFPSRVLVCSTRLAFLTSTFPFILVTSLSAYSLYLHPKYFWKVSTPKSTIQ